MTAYVAMTSSSKILKVPFCTWMEDQVEDVVAPRKVYKDMQKAAAQSKATFFA